jgi:hypothetical protein
MLTIRMCFLNRRGPADSLHLDRFSSKDKQPQIIVGELVFVRAKFESEGVGFRAITSGDPVTGRFLKAIRDHISIPPRYQEATTCSVRTIPDSTKDAPHNIGRN